VAVNAREAAKDLVRADTSPGRGTAAGIPVAVTLLERAGMQPRVIEANLPAGPRSAVVATKGPALMRGGLLLVAHLDTAHPGDASLWPHHDPWRLTSGPDGTLVGLGIADAKGALAAMAQAIAELAVKPFSRPLSLVLTFDALGSQTGLPFILQEWEDTAVPDRAILAAPTGLRLADSHPGWIVLRITLSSPPGREAGVGGHHFRIIGHGRSVPATHPGRGRSALLRVLRYIEQASLRGLRPRTLSIDAGRGPGSVPDRCEAVVVMARKDPPAAAEIEITSVDAGPPGPSVDRNLQVLRRLLDDLPTAPSISAVNTGRLEAHGEVTIAEIGVIPRDATRAATDAACSLAARAAEAFPDVDLELTITVSNEPLDGGGVALSFPTEAPILAARGIRTSLLGPGDQPGCSGRPGESVPADSLTEAVTTYREVISAACLP
jgi:hypothetical protein